MDILDDVIGGAVMVFLVVWIVIGTVIWWIVGNGEPLTLNPYDPY